MHRYKVWFKTCQDMLLSYETKCWNLEHLQWFAIMVCTSKALIIILNSFSKT
jgi:hypothetical protein